MVRGELSPKLGATEAKSTHNQAAGQRLMYQENSLRDRRGGKRESG